MEPSDMLTGANLILITVVLAVTGAVKALFVDFFASKLGQRILPALPIVLAVGLSFIGIGGPSETISDKFMVGLMSGLSAAMAFKLGKTTVMGKGIDPKK